MRKLKNRDYTTTDSANLFFMLSVKFTFKKFKKIKRKTSLNNN